ATSLRAFCADRLGRRDEAAALHREVIALAAAHPEWNAFAPFVALAHEGVARPLADAPPFHSFLMRVPF
ncbi:MAG: hypothetical protein DCC71_18320, partial [Proteobacteria bacterium]